MKIELIPYDEKFLDLSWDWLNDTEVKEMSKTPNFTKQDQKIWFDNLKFKSDYMIWGIEANNIKIGACGLKNITNIDCEYWGYIGEKSYWGKGIGIVIMRMIEEKAKYIKLNSIWLQVSSNNNRAIKLYQNSGYIIEKNKFDLIIMRKNL